MKSGLRQRRILLIVTAALALFQVMAALRLIFTPAEILQQTHLVIPLEMLLSLFWAGAFARITFVLLRGKLNAVRYTYGLIGLFLLASSLRLAIFIQSEYDRQRLPFLIAAVFVLIIVLIVAARRASPQKQIEGDF